MEAHWQPEGYTVPNAVTYPFAWLWDSCFHAVIWAALGDDDRALTELAHVFRCQDERTGFVPHIDYQRAPTICATSGAVGRLDDHAAADVRARDRRAAAPWHRGARRGGRAGDRRRAVLPARSDARIRPHRHRAPVGDGLRRQPALRPLGRGRRRRVGTRRRARSSRRPPASRSTARRCRCRRSSRGTARCSASTRASWWPRSRRGGTPARGRGSTPATANDVRTGAHARRRCCRCS